MKYDKLPPKSVDLIPYDTAYIDLVGPYIDTDQKCNSRILNTMIFVDPAIGLPQAGLR